MFHFICFHPGFDRSAFVLKHPSPAPTASIRIRIIGQTQFVLLMTPSNDSWKVPAEAGAFCVRISWVNIYGYFSDPKPQLHWSTFWIINHKILSSTHVIVELLYVLK